MKTFRFNQTIVTAAAVGTLILIGSVVEAQLPQTFSRARGSERDDVSLTNRVGLVSWDGRGGSPNHPRAIEVNRPYLHLRSVNNVGCDSWSASALARCSRRSIMNLSSAGSTGRG